MSARISAKTLRQLIVIGLVALWELLPRTGLIPELFLPSLSSTLIAGWTDAGEYGHALAVTLYEVVVSMAFACGGGILLGVVQLIVIAILLSGVESRADDSPPRHILILSAYNYTMPAATTDDQPEPFWLSTFTGMTFARGAVPLIATPLRL